MARLATSTRVLASLDVPEVVRTFGLVKHGRGVALVLEDLGDRSVESSFRDQRPSLTEFLDIAIDMAGALAARPQPRIIHKDINPHHVLQSAHGVLKLIDFGIATELSREAQAATSADRLEGTLAYMSPEQTGRMNRASTTAPTSTRSASRSTSSLTGRLPVRRRSDPLELVHCHIARAPAPAARGGARGAPGWSPRSSAKLLAKRAEDRYQSAFGLEADLERVPRPAATRRGASTAFPLGRQRRLGDRFQLPQKLYGREREIETLLAAFERARRGGTGLLLVAGYSGIGKSALVNEIHKPIVKGGDFVAGQVRPAQPQTSPTPRSSRPSAAWSAQLLTEPPARLGRLARAAARGAGAQRAADRRR